MTEATTPKRRRPRGEGSIYRSADFRTYRQSFGPLPLWTYFSLFEFESMTAWGNDPETPSCEEVWAPIYSLAQPNSFAMSFWSGLQRESWFER